eukprot:SAG22_NODE_20_length_32168_cov_40.859241_2_plen_519_part_00
MLIRITTTAVSADSDLVSFKLDDDGHNGPWWLNTSAAELTSTRKALCPDGTICTTGSNCLDGSICPALAMVHEFTSCIFDNHFSISKESEGDGWTGTMQVVGYVEDSSVYVPHDESWIIQGSATEGVPQSLLMARISSGGPSRRTNADFIIRHVRFSGLWAPLDLFPETRGFSIQPNARLGSIFFYEGGIGSTIHFEGCVFDHVGAAETGGQEGISGGALMISGRAEAQFGSGSEDPYRLGDAAGITMVVDKCLFWKNYAINTGAWRIVNVWPLIQNVTDSNFVDNDGFVGHHIFTQWYPNVDQKWGASHVRFERTKVWHTAACDGKYCGGVGGLISLAPYFNFGGTSCAELSSGESACTSSTVWMEDVEVRDHSCWFRTGTLVQYGQGDGVVETTLLRSNHTGQIGTNGGRVFQSGAFTMAGFSTLGGLRSVQSRYDHNGPADRRGMSPWPPAEASYFGWVPTRCLNARFLTLTQLQSVERSTHRVEGEQRSCRPFLWTTLASCGQVQSVILSLSHF